MALRVTSRELRPILILDFHPRIVSRMSISISRIELAPFILHRSILAPGNVSHHFGGLHSYRFSSKWVVVIAIGSYLSGLYLWSFRGLSWRGVAGVLVEFGYALKEAATICKGGFGTEDGGTFEIEDAERGEIVLNQIVDGSHDLGSGSASALLSAPRKASSREQRSGWILMRPERTGRRARVTLRCVVARCDSAGWF